MSDFGLAKLVRAPGSGSDPTRSLAILGTPQYLPPEIARGSLSEASTAGDLAADLRAWLSGRPVAARSPVAAERAWRWARRNPMVATLAACVALALGLGLATEFHSRARLSASFEATGMMGIAW